MSTAPAASFPSRVARAVPFPTIALSRLGYAGLVGLTFLLPFEATQRPIVRSSLITLTDLGAALYLVAALALATLYRRRVWRDLAGRRVAAGLLAALCLASGLSAVFGTHPANGLKWTFDLMVGGVLWLAIPYCLEDEPPSAAVRAGSRLRSIGVALVAGAALSALVGLVEIAVGPGLDDGLLAWFKEQPTVIGPYLRLSGTFNYANTAAGYLAMTAPFAVAALLAARKGPRVRLAMAALATSVILAALLFTYSRGAFLGLASGAIVFCIALRKSRPRPHLSPALIAACTAVVFAIGGGVALFALYSGPALLRLTTQSDLEWYRAGFSARLPHQMRAGEVARVPVTVRNTGELTWTARGATPYHLSYHWLLPGGTMAVLDGLRTSLRHDLTPGGSATVRARVLAPPKPGRYRLVWDIAEEHVTWIGLHTGIYRSSAVMVSGPAVVATRGTGLGPARSTPLMTIPAGPSQPERSVLWAAALRMIRAHPILGVGPDGYRLLYGRYESPPQQSWDERIFANSLPLELTADLGLVGAALFLVFLIAACRDLLVRTARGTVRNVWEAAVMAALAVMLTHGLVDYLLGSHAVNTLMWVLLGVAASRAAAPPFSGSPASSGRA